MRKRYDKLIRDGIPEVMDQAGVRYEVRTLDDAEFRNALRRKLIEEAEEAAAAWREDLVRELADLMEVVRALAQSEDVDLRDVESVRRARANERGGFNGRLFLEWTEERSG